jgi:hypothetical protein
MKASHAAEVTALTASFRKRVADLTTDHLKAVDKLKKYGESLVGIALRAESAIAALKLAHGVTHVKCFHRSEAVNTCVFASPAVTLKFEEKHYNVSLFANPNPTCTAVISPFLDTFHLLHPEDHTKDEKLRVSVLTKGIIEKLKTGDRSGLGWQNWKTSANLDEFSVDGKFYIGW